MKVLKKRILPIGILLGLLLLMGGRELSAVSSPLPVINLTTNGRLTDLKVGDTLPVSWIIRNLPLNNRCWTNSNNSAEVGGLNGLSVIDKNLAGANNGGFYTGSTVIAVTSLSPVNKKIRISCGIASTPVEEAVISLASFVPPAASSTPNPSTGQIPVPANFKITLASNLVSPVRMGETFRVNWGIVRLPANAKCWNNWVAGPAQGLANWKEANDKLLSGTLSGTIEVTAESVGNKRLKILCGDKPIINNNINLTDVMASSSLEFSVIPDPNIPVINLSISPTTGLKVGDIFNFKWDIKNWKNGYKCWATSTDVEQGLSGWAKVGEGLANGLAAGNKNIFINVAAPATKILKILCGPNNSLIKVESLIKFTVASSSSSSGSPGREMVPVVSNVRVEGINGALDESSRTWLAGDTKDITFDFDNFKTANYPGINPRSANVSWVSVAWRHPKTNKALVLTQGPTKQIALWVGQGQARNKIHKQMIGPKIAERLEAKDPALTPYFDGYQTMIEICPVFSDGMKVLSGQCGLSPVFSVKDRNNSYSDLYKIPAGQSCFLNDCVCVKGERKRCGNPMQSGSTCPLQSSNYPLGTCSSVSGVSKLISSVGLSAPWSEIRLINWFKLFLR